MEGVRNAATGLPGGKKRGSKDVELWRNLVIGEVLGASSLVYNPHAALSSQIASAAKSIEALFSEIDSSLDKGKTVKEAVRGRKVTATMHRVIASARLHGFLHASQHSKKLMPSDYGNVIRGEAEKRAARVNRLMRRTSKRVLRSSPDSQYVLSKDRAIAAVRYEAGNAYFQGMKDGFRGTGFKKRWVTTSQDPCDECSENESDGPLGIDEVFSSGDDSPLLHLRCQCWLAITGTK